MISPESFVEQTIKCLVDYPDEVRVERSQDDLGVLLMVYVSPMDLGLVIGRQGGTANAMRVLLKTVGMKNKSRVSMKIYQPNRTVRDDLEDGFGGGL